MVLSVLCVRSTKIADVLKIFEVWILVKIVWLTDKILQLACLRELKVVQGIKEMGDYMRKLGVPMMILEVKLGSLKQYVR